MTAPAGGSSERLVIVSNRLPFQTVAREDGKTALQPGGGGLAAAMEFVLRKNGGVWIGWPGDGDLLALEAAGRDLTYEIVPVSLDPAEVAGFYDGFTNRTLWPLFHDLVGRTTFDAAWWKVYGEVNLKFARKVLERARSRDLIWVHDFHLLLVGAAIRRERQDVRLGFFLHTPFPPSMLFQRLPWRREIAAAMLEFDVLGFHTERDLAAFVRTVMALCPEARSQDFSERHASWEWKGRTVRAMVFPISVDFGFWDRLGRDPKVAAKAQRYRKRVGGRKVILGVDRLDYSKGIPQRIRAFSDLLERHPEERERVQFLQIAVPSRTSVFEYKEIKREIDGLIGQVNGRYGTPSWVPVNYLYRRFDLEELAVYYRAADVAMVTPIKDGMNLVAKEFCASSVDGKGVLVLSEFAGAAFELDVGALIVNPHDTVGMAEALHEALHMAPEEQKTRLDSMRKHLEVHDVHAWAGSFIAAARGVDSQVRTPAAILEAWDGWRAPRLLLSLDYDGTLVPIQPTPELAAPDEGLRKLLDDLADLDDLQVVLCSGRTVKDLARWFPPSRIILVGGHGATWRRGEEEDLLLAPDWRLEALEEARTRLSPIVDEAPGSLLEWKGFAIAVHYRLVPEFVRPRLLRRLRRELRALEGEHPELEVIEGRCVLELVLRGVDKGLALDRVRGLLGFDDAPVVALGDDTGDEAAFESLGDEDLSIHVGWGPTSARWVLPDPAAVRELLEKLVALRVRSEV